MTERRRPLSGEGLCGRKSRGGARGAFTRPRNDGFDERVFDLLVGGVGVSTDRGVSRPRGEDGRGEHPVDQLGTGVPERGELRPALGERKRRIADLGRERLPV